MSALPERRSGQAYLKIISVLFAGLLATSGIIWNNSQNQIKASLDRIEKLMEAINNMQKEMAALNYKFEMLQYRIDNIDSKISNFSQERENEVPSRPRFGK